MMDVKHPAHPSKRYPYQLEIQATLRDTDGLGHVNNAVYLSWLEEIRNRYIFERRGLGLMAQFDFILASARLDFRSPVLMHETIDLWLGPSRLGHSSWDFVYEARARADSHLILEASTVQVMYDYTKQAAIPIPEEWRRVLQAEMVST